MDYSALVEKGDIRILKICGDIKKICESKDLSLEDFAALIKVRNNIAKRLTQQAQSLFNDRLMLKVKREKSLDGKEIAELDAKINELNKILII